MAFTVENSGAVQASTRVEGPDTLDELLASLDGGMLAMRFDSNLSNWTRRWVRRGVRVWVDGEPGLSKAMSAGLLTEQDLSYLAWLDALVRGSDAKTGEETYLAVELSYTVSVDDVEHAERGAAILRRAELGVRPLVGGYQISSAADELAVLRNVEVALWRPAA